MAHARLPAFQAVTTDYASNSFPHFRGNIAASINLTSVLSTLGLDFAAGVWAAVAAWAGAL